MTKPPPEETQGAGAGSLGVTAPTLTCLQPWSRGVGWGEASLSHGLQMLSECKGSKSDNLKVTLQRTAGKPPSLLP